jgi:hypothetical protein
MAGARGRSEGRSGRLAARHRAALLATLVGLAFAALALGCCKRSGDGDDDPTSASGPIFIPTTERAWVDVVACRAGACSEGTLDSATPDAGSAASAVTLVGATKAECWLTYSTPSPLWSIDCTFDVAGQVKAADLEPGDTEPLWLEVRRHDTQTLLVRVDTLLQYQGASDGPNSLTQCGNDVWARVSW